MKRKGIFLIAVFCLVATLAPYNTNAEEEVTIESEEVVEEVGVVEEVQQQESDAAVLTAEPVVASRRNTRSAVVYPATIGSIFPDAGLAQVVARKITKAVTDEVTEAELAAITSLSAQGKGISNLTGIEELPGLTTFYLSGNALTDISTVNWSNLTQLTALSLDGNQLTDISGVDWTGLGNLKTLLLFGNKLTNINCNWTPLTSLERLNLETNSIADISQVDWTGLSSLKTLLLNFNEISDISTVDWTGLTALEQLSLRGCKITKADSDYTPLSALKELNFTLNDITSIDTVDFTGLGNLTKLSFVANKITDLQGADFSKLTSLDTLSFSMNKITDLSGANWTGLSSLKNLHLDSNKISDLSTVDWAALTGLEYILSRSQVVELDPVDYATPIVWDNITKDNVGAPVDLENLSNGGTYDAATGKATWDLTAYTPELSTEWSKDLTINGVTTTFSGKMTLPVTFTVLVTFKDHDGTILQSKRVAEGAAIVAPTTPPRAGYVFAGWTPALDAVAPNTDVEYVATYSLKPVTPITTPTPTLNPGRTCQDDGYPKGYDWNGTACVLQTGYKVPNTGVK